MNNLQETGPRVVPHPLPETLPQADVMSALADVNKALDTLERKRSGYLQTWNNLMILAGYNLALEWGLELRTGHTATDPGDKGLYGFLLVRPGTKAIANAVGYTTGGLGLDYEDGTSEQYGRSVVMGCGNCPAHAYLDLAIKYELGGTHDRRR